MECLELLVFIEWKNMIIKYIEDILLENKVISLICTSFSNSYTLREVKVKHRELKVKAPFANLRSVRYIYL